MFRLLFIIDSSRPTRRYTDARTRLLCIYYYHPIHVFVVWLSRSRYRLDLSRIFFFYSFPVPPSLLSLQLLARYFLRLFRTNDDEGTFRGPPTIYSAHVALSYRFHEISDTDKLSIRSSKSRGGQFSLMAAV